MNKILFSLLLIVGLSVQAEMGIPVQLKLKSPSGIYPTVSAINVTLHVLSPSSFCILREETFSNQTITNGNLNLKLGAGLRGVNDPNLSLNDIYDNSTAKSNLTCLDANNNVTLVGQTFTPTASSERVIRVSTQIAADVIVANFFMRSVPYAIQAESVGGKKAQDLITADPATQLSQSNLSDLLFDTNHFNNLKNLALNGVPVTSVAGRTGAVALSAADVSGLGAAALMNIGTGAGTVAAGNDSRLTNALSNSSSFGGDVSGTASSISVNKIKGIAIAGTAPNAADVLQFDGSNYVPSPLPTAPVTSVAGQTGDVSLSHSDISGLGGAALLNVGTSAGTVAAGDDSRISGALQSSAFNSYISSASCSSAQSLYWNSVSGQFLCQNISLSSGSVSGLGGAALLNVGTSAGTVAAGNDSRIIGALQGSSFNAYVGSAGCSSAQTLRWNSGSSQFECQSSAISSAQVSGLGTAAALNAGSGASQLVQLDGGAKIPTSVLPSIVITSSGTPSAGQALVYNGSQWVPASIGVASFVRLSGNQTLSSNSLTDVTGLTFNVSAGVVYKYKFTLMYTSAATTTGLRLGLTYPAVTQASALAQIASGSDGTGAYYQGVVNSSGDSVVSSASQAAAPAVLYSYVEGVIAPSAAGAVQLRAASEVNSSSIVIQAGSFLEYTIVP